ncbi:aminopeptidase, partial [Listeria monocytogenes]|nr:aminopeptidase [Listeria monocytogenes]
MTVFSEKLEKYAELIVKVGVNVQPEQKVVIMAPVDAAPLVRLISKYAFEVGAEDVIMDWRDEELGALRYKNAPLRVFESAPVHRVAEKTELAKEGACFISITS